MNSISRPRYLINFHMKIQGHFLKEARLLKVKNLIIVRIMFKVLVVRSVVKRRQKKKVISALKEKKEEKSLLRN